MDGNSREFWFESADKDLAPALIRTDEKIGIGKALEYWDKLSHQAQDLYDHGMDLQTHDDNQRAVQHGQHLEQQAARLNYLSERLMQIYLDPPKEPLKEITRGPDIDWPPVW